MFALIKEKSKKTYQFSRMSRRCCYWRHYTLVRYFGSCGKIYPSQRVQVTARWGKCCVLSYYFSDNFDVSPESSATRCSFVSTLQRAVCHRHSEDCFSLCRSKVPTAVGNYQSSGKQHRLADRVLWSVTAVHTNPSQCLWREVTLT